MRGENFLDTVGASCAVPLAKRVIFLAKAARSPPLRGLLMPLSMAKLMES